MKNQSIGVKLWVMILAIILPGFLFAQETAKKDTVKIFELSLEQLLNADVTTVSKSAEKQSDAPGIISVLTKDDMARYGGTTLKDILNRVPGLIASGSSAADLTTFAARGDQLKATCGHVLLLINGRPVREISSGGVSSEMYETFPVNIIERIEVIKGPGSVLYGSDAFSGVINIITEKSEKTSFSVSGLAEAGGGYGTSGEMTIKSGDLSILAAGRYLKKDTWNTTYDFFNPLTRTTSSVSASIPDKGPGAYLGINYKGLSIMSTYNEWNHDHFGVTGGEPAQWKKVFSNLGYNVKVNEKWNMDVNITYVNATDDYKTLLRSNSNDLVAEWTNSLNLSAKSKLVIGALAESKNGKAYDTSTPQEFLTEDGKRSSWGLYAQADYHLLESLKLIGGLQANKVENIKMNLVPRAGLIWNPISRFNVKVLYSEAFRAPSISETNLDQMYLKGDPNLKPESVSTIDMGINYQGEQAQVGISLFQSQLTNIINYDFSKGYPGHFANLGEVTFNGVEFEGKYYVNKSLYLNGSVLYQTSKHDSTKNLSPIANLGTKAGISYVWDKGITIGLFDIYQGDLDKKYIRFSNSLQGAYNLLNLHANFELNKIFALTFKPNLNLFFDVDNMLDKIHFGSEVAGNGNGFPSISGRAIYFGLNATF